MKTVKQEYEYWLRKVKDEKLLDELISIKDNPEEIQNRFFRNLQFGTGGLRGEIGAGTNCLNIYTVSKISRAAAEWCKEKNGKKVIIGYDSRKNSLLFAKAAAAVFCSRGLYVFLTKDIMPTPFLSFAIRYLKADLGVMITASHNPPQYNGYKIYDNTGCQLTGKFAEQVSKLYNLQPYFVNEHSYEYYQKMLKTTILDDEAEEEYIKRVLSFKCSGIVGTKVAYSPLNGAGYKLIPQILSKAGVSDVVVPVQQGYPDENFTTCKIPNPEKPAALTLAIENAAKNHCDAAIVTDPDADRIGVAVLRNFSDANSDYDYPSANYAILSGNEIGLLLTEYLLSNFKLYTNFDLFSPMEKNPLIITTIVSSPLTEKIAKEYNAEVCQVLTGFKYIGEKLNQLEDDGQISRFVCAFEESHGYLAGEFVRDKDACLASYLICQMVSFYKQQQKTLYQQMQEIYAKYGYCTHRLVSYEFFGAGGVSKIKSFMDRLRESSAEVFANMDFSVIDYLTNNTGLPPADVLQFDFALGARLIIRPSGTEPLIKAYFSVSAEREYANEKLEELKVVADRFFA